MNKKELKAELERIRDALKQDAEDLEKAAQ